ncbi:granzyme G-like [Paramacrobiotus metropolitanus]|uniref:granzyme G-like n=1 Tax=Paramacrobiotus metropolitanus TaxID=2943436 RepID=UPI0024458AA5|nr:granzyme G-like [Paramacrobiotus metropolitanus]
MDVIATSFSMAFLVTFVHPITVLPDHPNSLQIRNGHEATPHHYTWMVTIQAEYSPNDFEHVSGGTLLNAHQVLTAAHVCRKFKFLKTKSRRMRCVFGKHDVSQQEVGQVAIRVKDVSCFPQVHYKKHLHDICIMELESGVPFTMQITPAILAAPGSSMAGPCLLIGWGSDGYLRVKPRLQQMTVTPQEISLCQELEPKFSLKNICSQDAASPDHGDSGGPVMCDVNGELRVFGVHSYNVGLRNNQVVAAHVDVREYAEFIADPLRNPNSCSITMCTGFNCLYNSF